MRIGMFAALFFVLPSSFTWASSSCYAQLDELSVEYDRIERPNVKQGVEIRGPLGGVVYESYQRKPLVVACELALALAHAGRYFAEYEVVFARFSSAYSRRRIRSSGRWSQHAYGRAVDLHTFGRRDGETLVVSDHYEQGLGDDTDCIGKPITQEGAWLRTLSCKLTSSGLFNNVLDPDYDGHHYNHFHLDL